MRLYFVRHGESEANLLQEISNRGWKHGLTDNGRRQSWELAHKLRGGHYACIYNSPLMRAVETAEILSAVLQTPHKTNEALREYDCGVIEGQSSPQAWDVFEQGWREWLVHHSYDTHTEGGESWNDIHRRFEPFVRRLAEQPLAADIILVGHGGLYRTMLPFVLENLSVQWALALPIPNTGYVLADACAGRLVCLEWCGVPVPVVTAPEDG